MEKKSKRKSARKHAKGAPRAKRQYRRQVPTPVITGIGESMNEVLGTVVRAVTAQVRQEFAERVRTGDVFSGIEDSVFNSIMQSRTGAIINTNGNGTPGRRMAHREMDGRGRRAELIFPSGEVKVTPEHGAKAQRVMTFINQHKTSGITLRALVDLIGMPYSTVQSQVNKLVALKALVKRPQTAVALA